MMTMDAILLGGGVGKRFSESTSIPKQFQMLGNAPVFIHALRSLSQLNTFRQFILVMPEAHLALAEEQLDSYFLDESTQVTLIAGGERRQDSARIALEALEKLSPLPSRVIIHDACRPYLTPAFLGRVQKALNDRAFAGWIPVVPVVETLKRVENSQVTETVDRSMVHRVQTPQIFEYSVIRSLAEKVKNQNELTFTDDASLCEYYGIPVGVFEGDVRNLKVTYDYEISVVETLMEKTEKREPACEQDSDTTFTV